MGSYKRLKFGSFLLHFLFSDFSSVLKELKWPFTSSAVSSKALDVWQKQEKRFTELFHLLAKLDRLDRPVKREEEEEEGGPLALDDHMLLPLGQLLDPLRKRFKYHFCGDRKTNNKEKVSPSLPLAISNSLIAIMRMHSQSGTSHKCRHGYETTPTSWRTVYSPSWMN